jgi:hypothetical protein
MTWPGKVHRLSRDQGEWNGGVDHLHIVRNLDLEATGFEPINVRPLTPILPLLLPEFCTLRSDNTEVDSTKVAPVEQPEARNILV